MQRYLPPHLRRQEQRQGQHVVSNQERSPVERTEAGIGSSSSSRTLRNAPISGINGRGSYTRRDWSSRPNTNTNVLASPAGDIRPMRSNTGKDGKIVREREMEMMQSVSRSGGDGAEGDALKDWATQERYRRYINERIDNHYKNFKTPRDTFPISVSGTEQGEEVQSLNSIVLLFRKLREGVVASHRIDGFAIEVFESSARYSILASNRPQLVSALSGLIPGLYIANDARRKSQDDLTDRIAKLAVQETKTNGNINNRIEFTSLLLLYHLVVNGPRAFRDLYIQLTVAPRRKLHSKFTPSPSPGATLPLSAGTDTSQPFISSSSLTVPLRACSALSDESFSPLTYFDLLNANSNSNITTTPHERAILSWAEGKVRQRSWEMMKRSYMTTGTMWAEHLLGLRSNCKSGNGNGEEGEELKIWIEQMGVKLEYTHLGMLKLR